MGTLFQWVKRGIHTKLELALTDATTEKKWLIVLHLFQVLTAILP